jgi:hypothetical protein
MGATASWPPFDTLDIVKAPRLLELKPRFASLLLEDPKR